LIFSQYFIPIFGTTYTNAQTQPLSWQWAVSGGSPTSVSNSVSIKWNLPLLTESAELSITNFSGQTIESVKISEKEGAFDWDTKLIPNGIYLYQIKEKDKSISSGKIVVNSSISIYDRSIEKAPLVHEPELSQTAMIYFLGIRYLSSQ
ncbi:MAG: T9SS type A sorting domain-containing protein, partial [Bacteroidetes bacterium]|nr:T9SS type A sorting domain-containing protein [Bacteroidota bacterium]